MRDFNPVGNTYFQLCAVARNILWWELKWQKKVTLPSVRPFCPIYNLFYSIGQKRYEQKCIEIIGGKFSTAGISEVNKISWRGLVCARLKACVCGD